MISLNFEFIHAFKTSKTVNFKLGKKAQNKKLFKGANLTTKLYKTKRQRTNKQAPRNLSRFFLLIIYEKRFSIFALKVTCKVFKMVTRKGLKKANHWNQIASDMNSN